jgi:hypothetical protein
MERGVTRKSNNFHPKRTDVIWHTRKEEVFEQIGKILNGNNPTTETPGWFSARTPAVKKIIDKMTQDELNALDAEVTQLSRKGYDENEQRR